MLLFIWVKNACLSPPIREFVNLLAEAKNQPKHLYRDVWFGNWTEPQQQRTPEAMQNFKNSGRSCSEEAPIYLYIEHFRETRKIYPTFARVIRCG
jgi:hypothetical protein